MINPLAIKFAFIQGMMGIVFLYIIAWVTGAVQIIDPIVVVVLYIGMNLLLNIIIPGRYR